MLDSTDYRLFSFIPDSSDVERAESGLGDVQGTGRAPSRRQPSLTHPPFSPQDAKYHMQRCIDSGLWVPNSKSSKAKEGEEAGPGDPLLEATPKSGDEKDVSV